MDIVNINSFLKFGYFLKFKNPKIKVDFSCVDKSKYINSTYQDLLKEGTRLWKEAIHNQFEYNKQHVVPLSGGLDSRAILATLLEFTEAKNIHTYTFGLPKTIDYEIGCKIALKTGTKHTKYPLDRHNYTLREELNFSKRTSQQTLLFLHPPLTSIDELCSNKVVWSGAIIDVYFGRHYHSKRAPDFEQAAYNSFEENVYSKSICLTNTPIKDFIPYVDYDASVDSFLEREHIIDLLNRQIKFVAPHVLLDGFCFKTLISDRPLVSFALSVPNAYHENQRAE